MANKVPANSIPHSWAVDDWPTEIYPGKPSKARHIIRSHRTEMIASGALTRIGRDLVILGAGYSAWLSKNAGRVEGFAIAANRKVPNRPEAAA